MQSESMVTLPPKKEKGGGILLQQGFKRAASSARGSSPWPMDWCKVCENPLLVQRNSNYLIAQLLHSVSLCRLLHIQKPFRGSVTHLTIL